MAVPDPLEQRFSEALGQLIGPDFPSEIALAVSGGGDSMAMLALAHGWSRVWGVRLRVVTIDHGLRAESAEEAEMVAGECAALGHPHETLRWVWNGQGNVMDAARRARLSLIGGWRGETRHVLMAHTADDVAETFLLRLARGSGVDGLAAMQARRRVREGFDIVRPCLDMTRADLRHYARTLHVPWVEDPTNEDDAYGRARARKLLAALEPLGVTGESLRATAVRMQRASEALRRRAWSVARDICSETERGLVAFDRSAFEALERDTALRLMAAACMWVSGAEYKPRADGLEALLDRVLGGGAGTLIGAKAETHADRIYVFREYAAIAALELAYIPQNCLWDRRLRIEGGPPGARMLTVRALGEALAGCGGWRDTGLPRAALMASPAVFDGDTLVAAPVLEPGGAWRLHVGTAFADFLLSH